MGEEVLGIFSASWSMREEHGYRKQCIMFLTNSRVVVLVPEGIDLRTVAVPIIALAVGFVGFVLKNFLLLLIGLGAGIILGLVLGLLDFLVRQMRIGRAKKMKPDEILKTGKRNFMIPYEKTEKIEFKRFEEFRKGSLLMPSLPEHSWMVEFIEADDRHVFVLDSGVVDIFLETIKAFVPEVVETKGE